MSNDLTSPGGSSYRMLAVIGDLFRGLSFRAIKGRADVAASSNAEDGVARALEPSAAARAPSLGWQRRKLMNLAEYRLFRDLDALINGSQTGHYLLAQVSYGAFLEGAPRRGLRAAPSAAVQAVASQVADFLVIDRCGNPVLVIEHEVNERSHDQLCGKDQAKRIACERANIAFVEISTVGLTEDQRRDLLERLSPSLSIAAE
ncbi:MAG: DUF2726 domain-containing protein [Pseudomonadota bacterium]